MLVAIEPIHIYCQFAHNKNSNAQFSSLEWSPRSWKRNVTNKNIYIDIIGHEHAWWSSS